MKLPCHLLPYLLVLVLSGAAAAAEPAAVALMPLRSTALKKPTLAVLDELLSVAMSKHLPYRVITPEDIGTLIGRERLKDSLGCDDISCAAEIGGALGARYLLSASARKLGSKLYVTLSLIDSRKQQVVGRSKASVKDNEDEYERAIENAVKELAGVSTTLSLAPLCATAKDPRSAAGTPCWFKARNANCHLWVGAPNWVDWVEFIGDCKEGKANGQGTSKNSLNEHYVGQFKNGVRHGRGKLTMAIPGTEYVGQFVNGDQIGHGTLTFKSGDKYVGQFKNRRFNGQGTYTRANGSVLKGRFKGGKFMGQ